MRLIVDIFAQTLRTLWAHKLRSFLTMFGIAWGVGSLLLLVGLGEGFRSGNRKQFDSIGENVMFIWSGRAPVVQGSFTALRQYYLTYRDFQDIASECPSVAAAAPAISRGDIRAVSDFYQASGQIAGVPANFNQIRNLPLKEGRWINELDDIQKRAVIVIGDEVRRTLFPGRPAIGATILLNGIRFTVIGTLQKVGHGDNMNMNLRSFVPFHAMQNYFRPLNAGIARIRFHSSITNHVRGPYTSLPSRKFTRLLPAITDSIQTIQMPSMSGTQSRLSIKSGRFSML